MTRTGRVLVGGPAVVLLLAHWLTVAVAAPAEPTWDGVDPIASRPASAAVSNAMLTLAMLADIIEPLVMAAVCSAVLVFFSAGPRQTARARIPRRRWRG